MQVHKITLTVIDFDNLGASGVQETLERTRFPNDCISPHVYAIESRDIGEWRDDNPLNRASTFKAEIERLFGTIATESAPSSNGVELPPGDYTIAGLSVNGSKSTLEKITIDAPAAGAESVESQALHELAMDYRAARFGAQTPYEALIAYVNAWGAQQREAGRQELQAEADARLALANEWIAAAQQARERVTELEAALAQRAAGDTCAADLSIPAGYFDSAVPKAAALAVGGVDLSKLARWDRTDDGMQSGPGNDGRFVEFDDVRALLSAAPAAHTTEATPVVSAQAPVVAAPVGDGDERADTATVDSNEFRQFAYTFAVNPSALIAHVDQWGARRFVAGRRSMKSELHRAELANARAALTQQKGN